MFYDFLICALRFGWRALESVTSEIKHMDTLILDNLGIDTTISVTTRTVICYIICDLFSQIQCDLLRLAHLQITFFFLLSPNFDEIDICGF